MSPDSVDELWIAISVIIFLIILITYFLIIRKQYQFLESGTFRLQILSTRVALCLPFYAFFLVICVIFPGGFQICDIPITLFEGYSLYSFLTLLVTNLGGPIETIRFLKNSSPLCCPCSFCCTDDKNQFFQYCSWAQWHLIWTRTAVIIISSIASYSTNKHAKLIFLIFDLIATFMLLRGVVYLLTFFENVYSRTMNLRGVTKIFILKVSVGLLVVQSIIAEMVIVLGLVTLPASSRLSSDERTQSLVCFIILCEYLLLNAVSYVAFGSKITSPPPPSSSNAPAQSSLVVSHITRTSLSSPSPTPLSGSGSRLAASPTGTGTGDLVSGLDKQRPDLSFCQFLSQVFSFMDIRGSLDLDPSTLSQALVSSSEDFSPLSHSLSQHSPVRPTVVQGTRNPV